MSTDSIYIISGITRILSLLILKNGLEFLEAKGLHTKLLTLCAGNFHPHNMCGIRKTSNDLAEFQLFHMLKTRNRITWEKLLNDCFILSETKQWIKYSLLTDIDKDIPIQYLLVQQITEALNWRIFVLLLFIIGT